MAKAVSGTGSSLTKNVDVAWILSPAPVSDLPACLHLTEVTPWDFRFSLIF